MAENVLKANLAQSAERWLLPEVQSVHVVSAAEPENAAGFKKQRNQNSGDSAAPDITRAMTASQLEHIAQQVRAEAEASGRAEGYQQGYAEGQQKANKLLEECRLQIDVLIASITDDIEQEKAKLQTDFSQLLVNLCEAVCLRELKHESNIEEIVNLALQALPLSEREITVYLNPSDFKLLDSGEDQSRKWQIQASESVVTGGCRVSSENSDIDFTLQNRVHQIAQQVFDDMPSSSQL